MGIFKSSRHFPTTPPDLAVVASDLETHFRTREFEVRTQSTLSGWQIDIAKGGVFKSVLGMKTSLKIEIEPSGAGTVARAGVGILGQQALPMAVTYLIFWPAMVVQIWTMVQQSGLDDEAMDVIGQSLAAHGAAPQSATAATSPAAQANGKFCTACGQVMPASSKFCPECGTKAA